MNHPLPPNSDPQSTPEPGIWQQATNSTSAGVQQAAIGDKNLQIQGDNNWIVNPINVSQDKKELASGIQIRPHLNYGQVRQGAVENVQVIGGNLTIGNITQVTRQRSFSKPTGIPQNIPYSGAAQFVGRSHELATLHHQLQRTDRVAISAISGMGGVGKTELAIQYARQYTKSYPGGVCWLKARASSLNTQILDFAQINLGLFVPQELGDKLLDLAQQVDWCWQHWQPLGQVLVILDDVTDPASLKEVMPPANRFRVLLTTRQRQLDPSFFELSLDVLSPESALELLTNLIGKARIESDRSTAEQLCQWLGYLPLGLELVGRYLAEDPDLPLTRMLERLQIQRLQDEAIDTNDQQRQKNYSLMTAQASVRAAFELSWQELNPPESAVAQLLSLFALDAISWELVKYTAKQLNWIEQTLDDAKKQLYKLQLIQPAGEGCYKIHPLIREFLQAKLVESELAHNLKAAFAKSMAAIARQIPKSPSLEQLQAIVPVIPHLAQVTKSMTEYLNDRDLCQPFVGLARFYEAQGLYKQAEPWRLQCLSEAQTRLSIEHPTVDVAASLHGLAMLYKSQGRYSEAEPLFLQALELRLPVLKEHDPNVAESLHGLAELYIVQGRYSEAETLFLQTLELRQRLLGENNAEVAAESLDGLAKLYFYQGRYSEAEFLYEQILELRKQLLGDNHLYVANSLQNLAVILSYKEYTIMGKNPLLLLFFRPLNRRVESLFTQSIELSKRLLSEDHPLVAEKLHSLGLFYVMQKRYHKAEALFLKAIDLWQRSLGEEYPQLASSLNNLGLVYRFQGRHSKAEALFLQALDIHRRSLGEEHPTVATYLHNQAIVYIFQGKYFKAEPLLEQSRELAIRRLGANHPTTSLFFRSSNVIVVYSILQSFHGFFILQVSLIAFKLGIIPGLITAIIILTIAIEPLSVALVLLVLIVILLVIPPQISWAAPFCSNLFFYAFLVTGIRLLLKRSGTNYKFSPVSAVIWLFIKTWKAWSRLFTHPEDVIIFQRKTSRIVTIILKLVSFILQGIFALSILIVILTVTLIGGVFPGLIATSFTLLILMEQLFAATSLLGWLVFLWVSDLKNNSWAGWLFFSLAFLTLMLVGVKLILKWLRLRFRLLSAMQRGLTGIGSYALSRIQTIYNVFSSRKSR